MALLRSFRQQRDQDRRARQYRELIRQEALIGGKLFGSIAPGARREFFCLDENTWVWHEEWTDASGKRHAVTTRYDVRPHGVFKAQDGQSYQPLRGQEAAYFYKATRLYYQKVKSELYKMPV